MDLNSSVFVLSRFQQSCKFFTFVSVASASCKHVCLLKRGTVIGYALGKFQCVSASTSDIAGNGLFNKIGESLAKAKVTLFVIKDRSNTASPSAGALSEEYCSCPTLESSVPVESMEPVFGRFSALQNANGDFLFLRLVKGPQLEVLATDVAYRAKLLEHVRMPGLSIHSKSHTAGLRLIALLLAIPSTSWEIDPETLKRSYAENCERNHADLHLRCRDKAGLEIFVIVRMTQVSAKEILQEMHQSMFAAITALDATVRDAGGEKNSTFLDEKHLVIPSIVSVRDLLIPIMSRGQPVQTQAAFRKAAAADARLQGNRAFVIAATAADVRNEILGQRQARKEAEARKKNRQRELLREAKKRAELQKARKEQSLPVARKRKKSLFTTEEEEVPAPAPDAALRAIKAEPFVVEPVEQGGNRSNNRVENPVPGQRLPGANKRLPIQGQNQPGDAIGDTALVSVGQVPSDTVPKVPKKKKKRLRALV